MSSSRAGGNGAIAFCNDGPARASPACYRCTRREAAMSVEERLERLERQNMWMRRLGAVGVALVAAVFLTR